MFWSHTFGLSILRLIKESRPMWYERYHQNGDWIKKDNSCILVWSNSFMPYRVSSLAYNDYLFNVMIYNDERYASKLTAVCAKRSFKLIECQEKQ